MIGDDDNVNGVVLAVINLQWVGELVSTATQRSGASVLLLDGSGTLVAGSADQENLIGKPFAAQSLAHDMLTRDEGTVATEGFDGIRRIFAYVRVPWTQARLAVGLDERAVQADIDHETTVAYLQLALFSIFVLLVAWFGGEQLIVRPIRSLVRDRDPHRARRFPCAHHAGDAGSRSSSRLPPRSTTWRRSSPSARKNCASPTSTSMSWRASTA